MVKQQKNNTRKKRSSKGFKANHAKARKIMLQRNMRPVMSSLAYLAGRLKSNAK
jgi:hypothetical protein